MAISALTAFTSNKNDLQLPAGKKYISNVGPDVFKKIMENLDPKSVDQSASTSKQFRKAKEKLGVSFYLQSANSMKKDEAHRIQFLTKLFTDKIFKEKDVDGKKKV